MRVSVRGRIYKSDEETRGVVRKSIDWCRSRKHDRSTFYSGNAAAKFAEISAFGSGTLPDLLVAVPLGGHVNTREEVPAFRAKYFP